MATIQLDFTNLCAAQDMIAIIQKERNCTVQEAILFSINSANCKSIMTPVGLRLHIHFGVMTIRKESGFF